MAEGYIVRRGGSNLNFKVVASPFQPQNPSENTLWVNTDVPAPGWIIASEQPAAAEPGAVWIRNSGKSPVSFNALKKNGITVSPTAVKQFAGGAWVSRTARIFQGGLWKELDTYLIRDGFTGYTLKAVGLPVMAGYMAMASQTITQNVDSITITGKDGYGIAYIEEPVDLTPYSRLVIRGEFSTASTDVPVFHLNAWTAIGATIQANRAAYILLNKTGETVLDVSALNGPHIVGISMAGARQQVIYDLYPA